MVEAEWRRLTCTNDELEKFRLFKIHRPLRNFFKRLFMMDL